MDPLTRWDFLLAQDTDEHGFLIDWSSTDTQPWALILEEQESPKLTGVSDQEDENYGFRDLVDAWRISFTNFGGGQGQRHRDNARSSMSEFWRSFCVDIDHPGDLRLQPEVRNFPLTNLGNMTDEFLDRIWTSDVRGNLWTFNPLTEKWDNYFPNLAGNGYPVSALRSDGINLYVAYGGGNGGLWRVTQQVNLGRASGLPPSGIEVVSTHHSCVGLCELAFAGGYIYASKGGECGYIDVIRYGDMESTQFFSMSPLAIVPHENMTSFGLCSMNNSIYWGVRGANGGRSQVYQLQYNPSDLQGITKKFELFDELPTGFVGTSMNSYVQQLFVAGYYKGAPTAYEQGVVYISTDNGISLLTRIGDSYAERVHPAGPPSDSMPYGNRIIGLMGYNDVLWILTSSGFWKWNLRYGGLSHVGPVTSSYGQQLITWPQAEDVWSEKTLLNLQGKQLPSKGNLFRSLKGTLTTSDKLKTRYNTNASLRDKQLYMCSDTDLEQGDDGYSADKMHGVWGQHCFRKSTMTSHDLDEYIELEVTTTYQRNNALEVDFATRKHEAWIRITNSGLDEDPESSNYETQVVIDNGENYKDDVFDRNQSPYIVHERRKQNRTWRFVIDSRPSTDVWNNPDYGLVKVFCNGTEIKGQKGATQTKAKVVERPKGYVCCGSGHWTAYIPIKNDNLRVGRHPIPPERDYEVYISQVRLLTKTCEYGWLAGSCYSQGALTVHDGRPYAPGNGRLWTLDKTHYPANGHLDSSDSARKMPTVLKNFSYLDISHEPLGVGEYIYLDFYVDGVLTETAQCSATSEYTTGTMTSWPVFGHSGRTVQGRFRFVSPKPYTSTPVAHGWSVRFMPNDIVSYQYLVDLRDNSRDRTGQLGDRREARDWLLTTGMQSKVMTLTNEYETCAVKLAKVQFLGIPPMPEHDYEPNGLALITLKKLRADG